MFCDVLRYNIGGTDALNAFALDFLPITKTLFSRTRRTRKCSNIQQRQLTNFVLQRQLLEMLLEMSEDEEMSQVNSQTVSVRKTLCVFSVFCFLGSNGLKYIMKQTNHSPGPTSTLKSSFTWWTVLNRPRKFGKSRDVNIQKLKALDRRIFCKH